MNTNPTTVDPNDAALNLLLGDLGLPTDDPSEVIEDDSPVSEGALEAAVGEASIVEAQSGTPVDGSISVASDTAKATKKAEEARVKAEAKAKRDADKAAKKAVADLAKETKRAEREANRLAKKAQRELDAANKPKRIKFANKTERIKHVLGDKLNDYLVLEVADAALPDAELAAKQAETLATIDAMGQKVKNRTGYFLEFAAGKRATINNVQRILFGLLKKDGQITTGDKGNYHAALLARPYSPAAARSMGNNTVNAMRTLKVIVQSAPQTYVPNPNSLLFAKVSGML